MTSDPEELEQRLAALERRVAALADDGQLPDGAPTPPRLPGTGDPLWALHELKRLLAARDDSAEPVGESSPPTGAVLIAGSVHLQIGPLGWQYALTPEALLEEDWSDYASLFAALGHPVRLALLQRILAGTTQTSELANSNDLGTTGQLHHHLRILVAAGWLRTPRRGHYEVPSGRVIPLLATLVALHDG